MVTIIFCGYFSVAVRQVIPVRGLDDNEAHYQFALKFYLVFKISFIKLIFNKYESQRLFNANVLILRNKW